MAPAAGSPRHPAAAAQWWARPRGGAVRGAAVRGAAVAAFASRQSAPRPTLSAYAEPKVRTAAARSEVAVVAARRRGAVPAAAVGRAREVGSAAAGETERWEAPVVLTASSAPRSGAAPQVRAAAVVSADPAGVVVEPAAATLVGRVRDMQGRAAARAASAAAARAASPVEDRAASPGAAQLAVPVPVPVGVAARRVAAVAAHPAEIPAGRRALDRRA
jgi:hypothetical protein